MHPIAFASRSLTTTEQQYAQIEKECLAVVSVCGRFNGYIYGNSSARSPEYSGLGESVPGAVELPL